MIYEIIMSKGEKIKIDEADLAKLQENIKAPFVRVKQAIINPSFLVMIVPTNQEDTTARVKVELEGNVAKVTGTEEIPVLADLMGGEVKRLN
jgi:hypothetical protein